MAYMEGNVELQRNKIFGKTDRIDNGININKQDEIKLSVRGNEGVRSNLQYAQQVAKATLDDVRLFKSDLGALSDLVLDSQGRSQAHRDSIQREVEIVLSRMNKILQSTFSGLHMLQGGDSSLEVALDGKYYSNPDNVPKIVVSGPDLTLSSLMICGLQVNVPENSRSPDPDSTMANRDAKNLERILFATNKVKEAEASLKFDLNAIEDQSNLITSKIEVLKGRHNPIMIDGGHDSARCEAIELGKKLAHVGCSLAQAAGHQEMHKMLKRIS